MNFLHSIILTVKMGSGFSIFRSMILELSSSYHALIGSSSKRFELLPPLFSSILYYHILSMSSLWKNIQVRFDFYVAHNMILTYPTYVPNRVDVGMGTQT